MALDLEQLCGHTRTNDLWSQYPTPYNLLNEGRRGSLGAARLGAAGPTCVWLQMRLLPRTAARFDRLICIVIIPGKSCVRATSRRLTGEEVPKAPDGAGGEANGAWLRLIALTQPAPSHVFVFGEDILATLGPSLCWPGDVFERSTRVT